MALLASHQDRTKPGPTVGDVITPPGRWSISGRFFVGVANRIYLANLSRLVTWPNSGHVAEIQ